ncbi:MAG: type 1 glutamine amidotransferase [Desulfuromonadaceae bacterium]|nr:type 1 glutamine amidotransferase [Desulfuromonadaceae bacterium]MDD2847251.1 type 1 glutamine amidotransferase [Desulfuromonadaceae bacterium]MDD4130195.1 type 1 glutamine amidotransferase [Desulfuromonadaceae bacterium]
MLQIIQNDPEVPPGNIIDHLTVPYAINRPYSGERLPEADQISALIVLGGAMGANDDARFPFLSDVKELIRQVVAQQIPYLGICLGGQLLAAALGAEVISNRWEEQGTLDVVLTEAGKTDPFFNGIAETFNTFQWHHDSFDLPAGCVLLASSDACPHQAFRVGESAWGLQFHPEVTEKIIRAWCAWDRATAERTGEFVADFYREEEKYRSTAQRFLHNFLHSVIAPR